MAVRARRPEYILSATRTPLAPSILQFRGGQHRFQLGIHSPQRTARAAVNAAHFSYWPSHIRGRAHGGPQLKAIQLRMRSDIDIASGVLMAIAEMFYICASRPYTKVVTTCSKHLWPYLYLPYRKTVECGNQCFSACDSPLNLLRLLISHMNTTFAHSTIS